jgi:hypothetical protein
MLEQLVLRAVGVLELVHQDVTVAPLVAQAHVLMFAQQLLGFQQQVVKVQGVVLCQQGLVTCIRARHSLMPVGRRLIGLCGDQIVLGARDRGMHRCGPVLLAVHIQVFERLDDQFSLIVRIIDQKVAIQAKVCGFPTQDAHAGRVKGADGQPLADVADQGVQPRDHLAGGFVGKGHRQNAVG